MSKKKICLRIALTSGIVAAAVAVIIYAELIHLLNVVSTYCKWPTVANSTANDGFYHFLIVADIHLQQRRWNNMFSRRRDEWVMQNHYALVYSMLNPKADALFVLGDIIDNGQFEYEKSAIFDYRQRFDEIFEPYDFCPVYSVPGNHDVGFNLNNSRNFEDFFIEPRPKPSFKLRHLVFNDKRSSQVDFILLNSMAIDTDSTSVRADASKIAKNLIRKGRRPILIQHIPLNCGTWTDECVSNFQPVSSCLHNNASAFVQSVLNPRLAFSGHIHRNCHSENKNYEEYTVGPFWRGYRDCPTMTLLVASKDKYAISRCHLPCNRTVSAIYFVSFGLLFSFLLLAAFILHDCRK